jgi:hypothetical protein
MAKGQAKSGREAKKPKAEKSQVSDHKSAYKMSQEKSVPIQITPGKKK